MILLINNSDSLIPMTAIEAVNKGYVVGFDNENHDVQGYEVTDNKGNKVWLPKTNVFIENK